MAVRELLAKRPGNPKERVDNAPGDAYDVGGTLHRKAEVIRVESKPRIMGNVTVWSVCSEHA